eukprot:Lankesteria_metandrocarpae@DN4003_c0_g1_i1.p1
MALAVTALTNDTFSSDVGAGAYIDPQQCCASDPVTAAIHDAVASLFSPSAVLTNRWLNLQPTMVSSTQCAIPPRWKTDVLLDDAFAVEKESEMYAQTEGLKSEGSFSFDSPITPRGSGEFGTIPSKTRQGDPRLSSSTTTPSSCATTAAAAAPNSELFTGALSSTDVFRGLYSSTGAIRQTRHTAVTGSTKSSPGSSADEQKFGYRRHYLSGTHKKSGSLELVSAATGGHAGRTGSSTSQQDVLSGSVPDGSGSTSDESSKGTGLIVPTQNNNLLQMNLTTHQSNKHIAGTHSSAGAGLVAGDGSTVDNTGIDISSTRAFGTQSLTAALQRLQLPESVTTQTQRIALLCGQPNAVALLQAEKKRIKEELKAYDYSFRSIFGYLPLKKQKEPLRPLYAYYKKIRSALIQKNSRYAISTGGVQDTTGVPNSGTPGTTGNRNPHLTNAAPAGNTVGGDRNLFLSAVAAELNESSATGLSRMSADEIAEDIRRLQTMQELKQQVAMKLQAFQDYFLKTFGRKIVYHKDIVPMEGEYKKYKMLREQIQKLSESIRRRQRFASLDTRVNRSQTNGKVTASASTNTVGGGGGGEFCSTGSTASAAAAHIRLQEYSKPSGGSKQLRSGGDGGLALPALGAVTSSTGSSGAARSAVARVRSTIGGHATDDELLPRQSVPSLT